jgi:uncharacterized protein
MPLYEEIDRAFKNALKAQESLKVSTLRMLKAALKYREIQERRKLSEEEIKTVISTQIKQRREAMVEFSRAGRLEMAQKEEEELNFLLFFLPPQLSEGELITEIKAIIGEVDAVGPQDGGKVMKAAMSRLAGRAEGKMIHALVKRQLSEGASSS